MGEFAKAGEAAINRWSRMDLLPDSGFCLTFCLAHAFCARGRIHNSALGSSTSRKALCRRTIHILLDLITANLVEGICKPSLSYFDTAGMLAKSASWQYILAGVLEMHLHHSH